MTVRYQADADLNQAIVTGVLRREPTVNVQTALAAGLEGVKDSGVLAIANTGFNRTTEQLHTELKCGYSVIASGKSVHEPCSGMRNTTFARRRNWSDSSWEF